MTSTRAPVSASADANSAPATGVVPLRHQYLQIKHRFPDTILFFRLGDFYETFDDDATLVAGLLDIVLTGREMGKDRRVPMAGIPHHAAEPHIARLVAAGHKVAVCEQVGDVHKGRGLVERDVTRVVTPGTVVDPAMLDARSNNFIAAVIVDGHRAGVAYADISTGQFATTEIAAASDEEVALAAGRDLLRIEPAEVVHSANDDVSPIIPEGSDLAERVSRTATESWRWRLDRARAALLQHFGVESLDGFGCAGKPLAIRAAGGLLAYLASTQMSGLQQLTALQTYSIDRFMTLDAQTRRNLELTESLRGERRHGLIAVLDQTRTPMGARLLRRWLGEPLLDIEAIRVRQDGIATFQADTPRRAELRRLLNEIGDVERLVNRAVLGIVSPRELAHLRSALSEIPAVQEQAEAMTAHGDLAATLAACADVHGLLVAALTDDPPAILGKGTAIREGFAPELDDHQTRAREARAWIANLERAERERTGIRTLKVGYNKVFGYYLEITAAALAGAERERMANGGDPGEVLPTEYLPKQTLVNATRYFTPRLKEYETLVLTAVETLNDLQADVFRRVVTDVARRAPKLLAAAAAIADVDVLSALAEVAVIRDYVRPELDDSGEIEIVAGRHPTLEAVLGRADYVPNDALLRSGTGAAGQITILTGPNMAGKSSWLRQVALITLLAQIGSFVPAERARIGIVDRIFTRIGAHDDIATGQSTFMVEMLETATILHHATPRSLVVLDEIGRGTSTYDGLAIARAIVEHLHNSPRLGCRTLFATHYHELTELESVLPRVQCAKMDVVEEGERVVFLRRVVPGGADRSYGIHVAQLAGIPHAIVRRAREILSELEHGHRTGATGGHQRATMASPAPGFDGSPALQLTLFGQPHPAVIALKSLDVEALSPLEALTKLFELQRMTRETSPSGGSDEPIDDASSKDQRRDPARAAGPQSSGDTH